MLMIILLINVGKAQLCLPRSTNTHVETKHSRDEQPRLTLENLQDSRQWSWHSQISMDRGGIRSFLVVNSYGRMLTCTVFGESYPYH